MEINETESGKTTGKKISNIKNCGVFVFLKKIVKLTDIKLDWSGERKERSHKLSKSKGIKAVSPQNQKIIGQ